MARVKFARDWFSPDGILYEAGIHTVPNDFLTHEGKEDEDGDEKDKKEKGKGILPSTAEVLSESDKLETTNAVVGVPIAPKTVSIPAGDAAKDGLTSLEAKSPEDPKVKAAAAEKEAAQVNAKK